MASFDIVSVCERKDTFFDFSKIGQAIGRATGLPYAVCKPSKDTDQTAVHSTVTPTAAKSLTVDDSSEVDENQVSFLSEGVDIETSY
jgi:hypothetical protein